jgi:hypothetical protein
VPDFGMHPAVNRHAIDHDTAPHSGADRQVDMHIATAGGAPSPLGQRGARDVGVKADGDGGSGWRIGRERRSPTSRL